MNELKEILTNNYPYLAFFTLVCSGTYTPGPNNLMTMSLGKKLGFRNTIPHMIGVASGYGTLLLIEIVFASFLFKYLPFIKYVMAILGTIYLVYMSINILLSHKKEKNEKVIPRNKLFINAYVFQFMNPKALFMSVTLVSTFLVPYSTNFLAVALFILILVSVTISSLILWATSGKILSHVMKKHELAFNIIMALLLLYCAYSIIMSIF